MSTKKQRTIEQIEAELSNAQAAQQRIAEELETLAEDLEAAVAKEAEATEHSIREGKEPKPSGAVAKLESRRAELLRQQDVIAVLADKLVAERLVHLLADAEEEQREKNAASDKALEKFRMAEAELTQAQGEAAWARENRLALREELVAVRRRLAERGVEEPTDLEERRRNAEEAERIRREAGQWEATMPIHA